MLIIKLLIPYIPFSDRWILLIVCGLRHELPVRQMAMNVYVLILLSVKGFFLVVCLFVFFNPVVVKAG